MLVALTPFLENGSRPGGQLGLLCQECRRRNGLAYAPRVCGFSLLLNEWENSRGSS